MAKTTRSGLGRGLNSLLGGAPDAAPISERTKDRETIVYNEREDVIYDEKGNQSKVNDGTSPSITGRIHIPSNPRNNVSRETIPTQNHINDAPKPIKEHVSELVVERKVNDEAVKANPIKEMQDVNNVILDVDIEKVQPNPEQPRTYFNEEDLKELSSSIKRNGLIQPILVRQLKDGSYQIIAGERRWQASKLANLDTIQVQVKDISDEKALELALIENIQRANLNPIEEAYGYKRLMERNKMTQADIAQAVSKGRSTIANALRLLELPEEAQQLLFEDKITAGHARAILSIPSKKDRLKLTQKLLDNKMTVRETEALARLMANKPDKKTPREPVPAVYKSVARALKTSLAAPVKVKSSKGKNKIEIEFKDERDLERIFDLINPD